MKPLSYCVFAIIFLALTGCLVYSNTFLSPFHFDDYFSIVANTSIGTFQGFKEVWNFWPTRFLAYYSLAMNYRYGKLDVTGYHWFNLVVHIISGILVWRLTLMILSSPGLQSPAGNKRVRILALLSGLLFVVHPIQTQAVTYIIQRTTSLAALFYLAALCFYAKARILQYANNLSLAQNIFYCCSLITATAAMFTKETAITLPFAVMLYEFCFFKKGGSINWKPVIPFLPMLFIIPLTMLFTHSVNFLELHRAIEPASDISPLNYLLTEFRVLATYLRLLFLPFNQNLDYDYAIAKSLTELNTLASFSLLVVIFVIAVKLFRRHRLISFSIFWFFLTLLPESSIIPIKDVIFEHRLYLTMFGYSLFAVSIAFYFYNSKSAKAVLAVLIAVTVSYAALAYKRNFVWQDELSLWNDTIYKSPGKARPYNERGFVYLLKGNYERAVIDFTKTLEIDPKYVSAYNNRGITYIRKEDYKQAIFDFSEAIKIETKYAPAYSNRAVAYFYCHEYEKAWEDLNKATALGGVIDRRFSEDLKKVTAGK